MTTAAVDTQSRRDLAMGGAIQGLQAWAAYWVVECFFSGPLSWLLTPGYEYKPVHPMFTALALAVYLAAGAGLGALLAVCIGRMSPESPLRGIPLVGPLSLAAMFVVLGLLNGEHVQLILAILLVAGIVASLTSTTWMEKLRPIANLWTVPLALLIYPYALTQSLPGNIAPSVAGALGVIAVFLISYVVHRLIGTPGRQRPLSKTHGLRKVPLWVAIFILLGLNFFLKQQAIITNMPQPLAAQRASGHANVILVTMDTVRADHLSLYGYARDTSPNLQAFARDAAVFTNAISAADMTLASHASIFTGVYPSVHGAHLILGNHGVLAGVEFGQPLPEHTQTLAGILSKDGYRTMAIVANNACLQHAFRLDQGFQYYSQPYPVIFLNLSDSFYLRWGLARILAHYLPKEVSDRASVTSEEVNREAFHLLEEQNSAKRPFLLFLNYMDAHDPYYPPAPYDVKYPGKDDGMTTSRYFVLGNQVLSRSRAYTNEDRQRDLSQYDGGVAYIDANLGQLSAKLKELKLYDNSLIIITSDHGQSFGEKQLYGHGNSVYQEQVHVPLIIKYPGAPHAEVRNDLATHVDLLPTILDSLGYPIPASLPGRSLRAVAPNPVTVISESYPSDLLVSLSSRFRRIERAAFSGPYKLITATNGKREFYDLSKDAGEEHNLYPDALEQAGLLEADLQHWIAALPKSRAHAATLDKRSVDRLKSLGYVQ